ncbi:hypothetical protein VL20_4494 [Microcystis panniformis FACHB-1757]|uniref:Uncharacterized protein n=1 Tax=Microcystis panniformis FACHB-1757 TaxID=1638788 RepID=A0A0K1S5Y5_9CHRO|nr:hypothetical protein VL20_4494 [Microcystis panniformis FACHB-1757]
MVLITVSGVYKWLGVNSSVPPLIKGGLRGDRHPPYQGGIKGGSAPPLSRGD